jgi:hypothetical protein
MIQNMIRQNLVWTKFFAVQVSKSHNPN